MAARTNVSKGRRRRGRRDGQPFCGGEKRNGEPCLREAGWGTDHPGTGKCKHHGGATQAGRDAAARAEVEGLATPIPVTPGQAILGVLQLAAGQLAYCTAQVGGLSEAQMFEETIAGVVPNRWVRLQLSIEDRIVKFARAAGDMGIQERQMQLAEEQTRMMGSLLEAVMDRIDLTPKQRKQVGPAIREALPALMAGNEEGAAV